MNLWEETTTAAAPSRRRAPKALVAAAMAMALLLPTAAYAGHQFNDVPNASPFHDDISWMAGTGITGGYPDGGFHPADPVSRQAMARFMKKNYNLFAGLSAVDSGTDGGGTSAIDTWTNVTGASVQVTIPPGTQGRIHATFTGEMLCNFGDNIFVFLFVARPACEVRLLRNGAQMGPGPMYVTDSDDGAADPDIAIDYDVATAEGVTGLLGPGNHTITVQHRASDADGNDDELVSDINEWVLRADVLLVDG